MVNQTAFKGREDGGNGFDVVHVCSKLDKPGIWLSFSY
jgi:hypothetical protein